MHDMMPYEQIRRFMQNDVIEVVPLAFMRGRTLNNAAIILDEAQNATSSQMLMFLTAVGSSQPDGRDWRREPRATLKPQAQRVAGPPWRGWKPCRAWRRCG